MKIYQSIIAVTATALALGSAPLFADGDEPWHFTYQIGGASLDSDRNTSDGDVYQAIGFGRFFGNHLSVDFEYDEFEAEYRDYNVAVPGATYDNWKLSTWGLMGRYHFTDNDFRPFLALGIGRTKHRSVLDEDDDAAISLGLGLAGQIHDNWSVRAQVLWRNDHDSGSLPDRSKFRDFIYTVGLSFDFGGTDDAPPPPPPPAKPAAPPPPPPNPDLDGDGVPNERDKCPNTRPGAVVDLDGCEVEAVISLENVHFDFDKATLRPEAIAILNDAAALLKTHERVVVEVAGHTDSIGTDQYNQGLSERRAQSVYDYLVSQGINASRLTRKGYGESQPVATNDTPEGRQLNRRVELIVLDR